MRLSSWSWEFLVDYENLNIPLSHTRYQLNDSRQHEIYRQSHCISKFSCGLTVRIFVIFFSYKISTQQFPPTRCESRCAGSRMSKRPTKYKWPLSLLGLRSLTTCIYVCIHVCTCIHVCVHIYSYIYIYVYIYIYIYICIYIHTHIYIYIYIHITIYICVHICIHTCTYICIYICIHL